MKFLKNNDIKYFVFTLIVTLWSTLSFILPDFTDSPINDFHSFLFVFLQFGLQSIATFLLLYAIGSNKYLFAVFLPLFAFLGAIIAYYRYAYKIVLTPMLIDATLKNDLRTSVDVISFALIIFVILSIAISLLFVYYRMKKISNIHAWYSFLIPIVLLFILLNFNGRIRNSVVIRFPYTIYYNFRLYESYRIKIAEKRLNPDSDLTCERHDSLSVVLILGESLRADHLSLNGYSRETTPNLGKRKNIVSFPNIYSEYTHTGRSVPHILTRADSIYIERAFTETSFVPLFKSCGFRTYWIANQESADYYIAFMKECDSLIYVHPGKTVFTYDKWLDEDLLPHTQNVLDKKEERKLFILHTIGSHWFYNSHFPDSLAFYQPIASSRVIKQCTPDEIINSYDNTILYTDHFLDRLIGMFEKENAVIIYLSDHGESLGENGLWLHAIEDEVCKNPACFIWYSNKYKEQNSEKIKALEKNKNKYYRTDFLFHSILSAGNIHSTILVEDLDIFSCDN